MWAIPPAGAMWPKAATKTVAGPVTLAGTALIKGDAEEISSNALLLYTLWIAQIKDEKKATFRWLFFELTT